MNRRRLIAALAVMALTMSFGALLAADAAEGTWSGIITDDSCGKKHAEMAPDKARECALRCAEKGGKLVLYDKSTDKSFALSDQSKAKEFAGDRVVVKGTLDADGKSIKVSSIAKGEPAKEGK